MNVETLAIASVGATALGAGMQQVRKPVTTDGRTTFRALFGMRIRTDGIANGIRFDTVNSQLPVVFSTLEFNARASGTEPQAAVTSGNQPVKVTLPVPMQIRRVRFSDVATGTSLQLHRMDGDELAEEPTKEPGNNQTVSGDFTDARFGIKGTTVPPIKGVNLSEVLVKGFPTGARVGFAPVPASSEPIAPTFFHVIPGVVGKDGSSPSGSASLGAALGEALQQHVDSLPQPYPEQLLLLLVVESDAPCQFQATQFAVQFGLVRNSFRAVLLRSADLIDTGDLATRLREAATPLTAFLRSHLSQATTHAIDRASRGLPEPVTSRLVRELNHILQTQTIYSAARFAGITLKPETLAAATTSPTGITRTRVNRALIEEAFPAAIAPIAAPSGDEKEVLKAQGATAKLDVAVDLPRVITVRGATLRLEAALRSDAPSSTTASEGGGSAAEATLDSPIEGAHGVSIDAARSAAVRLAPSAAIEVSGVSAALSSMTASAEIIAELREEQGGEPGRILGTASAKISRLDSAQWTLFDFAGNTAVLSEGTAYWLVLRTTNGSALWLAELVPGITRTGDPTAKRWVERGSFKEFTPLHQIWSARKRSESTDGGDNTSGGAGERLRVTIGNSILTPTASGKARVVNIKPALQALLAATGGGALTSAPIAVSALGKGSVTIYPPEIEYDL